MHLGQRSTPVPPELSPLVRLLRDRRVAFLMVGAINGGVGFSCFALAYSLFGGEIGYRGALVVAYAVAIGIAFILHRRFVFRVSGEVWSDFARFMLVNLRALVANALLLTASVELVRLPGLPAQLVALCVTVCISYLGHLTISFRRRHDATSITLARGDDDGRAEWQVPPPK